MNWAITKKPNSYKANAKRKWTAKKKKVIRKSLKSKQRVNDKLAIQLQPIILSF